jgi:hypothetical protein
MRRLSLLLLAMLPLCAEAQVFRWVDENGKVHYGDRPIAKEVKAVPVLREAKPQESVPVPGMKAEDVRKKYGEPERAQDIQTKTGTTLIWTYRKSKLVPKDFVVKLEGGEVTEVSTDTGMGTGQPLSATKAQAAERQATFDSGAAAARDESYQQQAASRAEAEKKQRCDDLGARQQRVAEAERRGGSAGRMDALREEKRGYGDQMWSLGCGS